MNATSDQKVLVFDFGAQYGQLIVRRVRDLHVYSEIVPCDTSADEIRALDPAAIILSGGPASVYAEDAPSIDPQVLELGVPVLGFCYGQQIMAVTLGGEVGHTEKGGYGPAPLTRTESTPISFTPLRRLQAAIVLGPVGPLELLEAEVSQRRVGPCPVVEALDVLEDLERRPLSALEGARVIWQHFFGQGYERIRPASLNPAGVM